MADLGVTIVAPSKMWDQMFLVENEDFFLPHSVLRASQSFYHTARVFFLIFFYHYEFMF